MKTFKEFRTGGYLPVDQYRPIADIGNMKSPEPRPKFALNANAKGPGLGTMNPTALLANKIKKFKKENSKK
jgi:hypothetical protein